MTLFGNNKHDNDNGVLHKNANTSDATRSHQYAGDNHVGANVDSHGNARTGTHLDGRNNVPGTLPGTHVESRDHAMPISNTGGFPQGQGQGHNSDLSNTNRAYGTENQARTHQGNGEITQPGMTTGNHNPLAPLPQSSTHHASQQVHAERGHSVSGKVEHALGSLVGSSALKAKGLQKEQEVRDIKLQGQELAEAERLEREGLARRERAVAHGAHPDNSYPPIHDPSQQRR